MTTMCFDVGSWPIWHPFSVGILAVPKSLEYWYMQSGCPRIVSGGSSSRRTALTNESAETTSEAARVTWLLRAGVGSSSSRKNGFRLSTTGLSKFRYESYPGGSSARLQRYHMCRDEPLQDRSHCHTGRRTISDGGGWNTYRIARCSWPWHLHIS